MSPLTIRRASVALACTIVAAGLAGACGRADSGETQALSDLDAELPLGVAAAFSADAAALQSLEVTEAARGRLVFPGRITLAYCPDDAAAGLGDFAWILGGDEPAQLEHWLLERRVMRRDGDRVALEPAALLELGGLPREDAERRLLSAPAPGTLRRFEAEDVIVYAGSVDWRARLFALGRAAASLPAGTTSLRIDLPRLVSAWTKFLRRTMDDGGPLGAAARAATAVGEAEAEADPLGILARLHEFGSLLAVHGPAGGELAVATAPDTLVREWLALLRPVSGEWPRLSAEPVLRVRLALDVDRLAQTIGEAAPQDVFGTWDGRLAVERNEFDEWVYALGHRGGTGGGADAPAMVATKIAFALAFTGHRVAANPVRHGEWSIAGGEDVAFEPLPEGRAFLRGFVRRRGEEHALEGFVEDGVLRITESR